MVEGFAAQDRGTLVIATEVLAETAGLVALPCYRWTHVVVVSPDHVLAREAEQGRTLTLRPPTLRGSSCAASATVPIG